MNLGVDSFSMVWVDILTVHSPFLSVPDILGVDSLSLLFNHGPFQKPMDLFSPWFPEVFEKDPEPWKGRRYLKAAHRQSFFGGSNRTWVCCSAWIAQSLPSSRFAITAGQKLQRAIQEVSKPKAGHCSGNRNCLVFVCRNEAASWPPFLRGVQQKQVVF